MARAFRKLRCKLVEMDIQQKELTDRLAKAGTPVYFTIDLDCLDPSVFPGTGTPEAGGVTFLELLEAIRRFEHVNVVGADVNELAPMLDGMKSYIEEGKVVDYQDHHYPSEMSVDAMIQTYLLDDDENALDTFMERFDTEWVRYNRDVIRKVQEYMEQNPDKE